MGTQEVELERAGEKSAVDGSDPQGVVTYASPVEAFATGIKNFDRRNRPLIA